MEGNDDVKSKLEAELSMEKTKVANLEDNINRLNETNSEINVNKFQ